MHWNDCPMCDDVIETPLLDDDSIQYGTTYRCIAKNQMLDLAILDDEKEMAMIPDFVNHKMKDFCKSKCVLYRTLVKS